MGLGGALDGAELDQWGDQGPSAGAAANVARLRTAMRARVMEATAVGRTARALEWFADFMASTARV
eukprot:7617-Pleurochrysis_carterae.AAC.1